MALIKCSNCENMVSDRAKFCPKCNTPIDSIRKNVRQETKEEVQRVEIIPSKEEVKLVAVEETISEVSKEIEVGKVASASGGKLKKRNGKWIIGCLLIIILISVGGYIYYKNYYLPIKIDREAPRYYTISNSTFLRSSQTTEVDYNKITSLAYGSELITYSCDTEWYSVKFGNDTGYIYSDLVVDKQDFHILNSVFGNDEARECIATAKCRKALLNYFKEKKYIGQISNTLYSEVFPNSSIDAKNQWQVFCKNKNDKPNSVYYSRLRNVNSKFTDFAVIITNIYTHERRLVIFYFDDDETPHLFYEGEAAAKYIENINSKHLGDGSGRKMLYFKYSNF